MLFKERQGWFSLTILVIMYIHYCHLHNSQGVGTGPADPAIVGPTKVLCTSREPTIISYTVNCNQAS